MLKFSFARKNQINELPQTPGVYVFKKGAAFLYIGKAINLKRRVKNHFQRPDFKDNIFIPETEKIGFISTGSEIEALILEAELIKKFQPKYNTQWKDSKNYFYVAITNEKRPRAFITHQPFDSPSASSGSLRASPTIQQLNNKTMKQYNNVDYIGPFVDGRALKQTLRVLRKVFPFRTCRTLPKKPCLYKELGLCQAPCDIKYPASSLPRRQAGAGKQSAKLKVMALAKRKNELFVEGRAKPILLKNLPQEVANLILRIRDEAHRFAIAYHRKLRDKTAFN